MYKPLLDAKKQIVGLLRIVQETSVLCGVGLGPPKGSDRSQPAERLDEV